MWRFNRSSANAHLHYCPTGCVRKHDLPILINGRPFLKRLRRPQIVAVSYKFEKCHAAAFSDLLLGEVREPLNKQNNRSEKWLSTPLEDCSVYYIQKTVVRGKTKGAEGLTKERKHRALGVKHPRNQVTYLDHLNVAQSSVA